MEDIEEKIKEFITSKRNNIHSVRNSINEKDFNKKFIYNEVSFQLELGNFLRKELGKDYIVQFERNINTLGYKKEKNNGHNKKENPYKKSEIDIVILNKNDKKDNYAIELKYHKKSQGEIPDIMYNSIKDMFFMNKVLHLKSDNFEGFKNTFAVMVVEDKGFYNGKTKSGDIYAYFRNGEIDQEYAYKQRNNDEERKKSKISIKDFYNKEILPIKWMDVEEEKVAKYYIIKFQ